MDKLKLIKGIVIVITLLLVFGSLLLLTVLYKRSQPKQEIYQEKTLAQPIGSSISSMVTVGNNLAILIKDGGEADKIIIYNPQTLQKVATIHLQESVNE